MDYTELQDNIWAVAYGTRSITREDIILTRFTEVSWMPSDNLNYLIICSVPSVLPNPTKN